MINFNLLEMMMYAKNHNLMTIEFNFKTLNLIDCDLKLLNDFCLNLKGSIRVSFRKEKIDNSYINVFFDENNKIKHIEYAYYINNCLELYKYRLYGCYDRVYYEDSNSYIEKEDVRSKTYTTVFSDNNFYTIKELLDIEKNLVFL
jgi:hypothetical protein